MIDEIDEEREMEGRRRSDEKSNSTYLMPNKQHSNSKLQIFSVYKQTYLSDKEERTRLNTHIHIATDILSA